MIDPGSMKSAFERHTTILHLHLAMNENLRTSSWNDITGFIENNLVLLMF